MLLVSQCVELVREITFHLVLANADVCLFFTVTWAES